jgi:hypothetical protein
VATRLAAEIDKFNEAKALGRKLQKLFRLKYTVIRIGDDFFAVPKEVDNATRKA